MKYFFLITLFINLLFANESSNKFQELFLNKQQIEFIKNHPIIRVSNEKNWAPYDYNENGQAKGYSIDYLNLIAENSNADIYLPSYIYLIRIDLSKSPKYFTFNLCYFSSPRTNKL